VTTFSEFWGRSANFGENGAGTSRAERDFLCVVNQTTFRQLRNGRFPPNLVTKRISGHVPPKSEIEYLSNRHLTQSRLQVTGCTAERYCLLHVVVQGPGSLWSFRGPVNFSVGRTVAELQGVKVAQFSDFGLFFPYKTPKTYLPVTSLQSRGYIMSSQNDSDFSM